MLLDNFNYHIFKTLFAVIQPKVCISDKLFPANLLSACRDDNRKSCILNGHRLSCPAQDVDRQM